MVVRPTPVLRFRLLKGGEYCSVSPDTLQRLSGVPVIHSLHSPQSEWDIPLAQWLESWASIRQSLGESRFESRPEQGDKKVDWSRDLAVSYSGRPSE